MLIQLITGNETFAATRLGGGSCNIAAFYRQKPGDEDTMIHEAAKHRHHNVQKIGNDEWINASGQNRNHGQWITSRYQVPERSYIQIMVGRHLHGYFTKRYYRFFLHMREGAALQRLKIPFTEAGAATLQAGYVEGRFDIIAPWDCEKIGLTLPSISRKHFEIDDYDEVFERQILEKESSAFTVPTVDTVSTTRGREVKVARPTTRRKLNI